MNNLTKLERQKTACEILSLSGGAVMSVLAIGLLLDMELGTNLGYQAAFAISFGVSLSAIAYATYLSNLMMNLEFEEIAFKLGQIKKEI